MRTTDTGQNWTLPLRKQGAVASVQAQPLLGSVAWIGFSMLPLFFQCIGLGTPFTHLNVCFKAVVLIKAGSTLRKDILDSDGEREEEGKSHQLTSGPLLHPRQLK